MRDDPSSNVLKIGDQADIGLCENCEIEAENLVNIESLSICEECAEELNLGQQEAFCESRCAICDWPINKPITEEESKNFVEGVKKWLKGRCSQELVEKIEKRLGFLENKETSVCRYDFFSLIKDIISDESEELASQFDSILNTFNFGESLIS